MMVMKVAMLLVHMGGMIVMLELEAPHPVLHANVFLPVIVSTMYSSSLMWRDGIGSPLSYGH